jgi:2-oxoglutarate ferredoxin oxidoreductase subunit beta
MFGKAERIKRYLREEMYPSIFCIGCGIGNVLNYTLRAIEQLQIDMDRIVFFSGIGCSSRLPGYIDADGLHTTHGRPLAFATGLKLARPELLPIVFTGDGDLAGIGGNHFIHAARRNVDMTVIAINNFNYGMTGGQSSPTTPPGGYTTTSPYGSLEGPFDLAHLAKGAGAPFIARWPVGYPYETIETIKRAIAKPGFSFVEMLIPCPTGYGRPNEIEDGRESWEWFKECTMLVSEYRRLTPEERAANDKIVIGNLWDIERKEYSREWRKLVMEVSKSGDS